MKQSRTFFVFALAIILLLASAVFFPAGASPVLAGEHVITATAEAGGSISPLGPTAVSEGAEKTFTITPDAGMVVGDVLVDGQSVGAVSSHTFQDVDADHTIAAIFHFDGYEWVAGRYEGTFEGEETVWSFLGTTVSPVTGTWGCDISPDGYITGFVHDAPMFGEVTITGTLGLDGFIDLDAHGDNSGDMGGNLVGGFVISTSFPMSGTLTRDGYFEIQGPMVDISVTGTLAADSTVSGDWTLLFSILWPTSSEGTFTGGEATSYQITTSAGSGGVISPSGPVKVYEGDDQTFTITPDEGMLIADVLVDGQSVGPVSSHTFQNVDSGHSVAALFEAIDYCPNDPDKTEPGTCGCGVSDVDSDNDGTPDCNDNCPNDFNKIEPGTCGCGVSDVDSDNDGTPDCNDNCPNDSSKTEPGTCGCGVSDVDSDNDGTPDCNDGCPNDINKIAPGTCGCGVSDADSDNDGTPDCNDNCPNDSNKTEPGTCGCGVSDVDSDNDGTLDCNDGCPGDPNQIDSSMCGTCLGLTIEDLDGNQVAPSELAEGETYKGVIYSTGAGFVIDHEDSPVSSGDDVLTDLPDSTAQTSFTFTASSPGSSILTVINPDLDDGEACDETSSGAAGGLSTSCELGGEFLVGDGDSDVVVTAVGYDAGHRHELYAVIDGQATELFDSSDIGAQVNLGKYPAGTLVQFRLDNLTTGISYFTGPAGENPDDTAHANLCPTDDPDVMEFGFEDLWGGGDLDYNDCMFTVSGVEIQSTDPTCCRAALRLEVSGTGSVCGQVTNVSTDMVPLMSKDVTVELQDPVTEESLNPQRLTFTDDEGNYCFNDVPWGAYRVRVVVEDEDDPAQYLPAQTGGRIVIDEAQETANFRAPALTAVENTKALSVTLEGDYQPGAPYSYEVFNTTNNETAAAGNDNSAQLGLHLAAGAYRLCINAEGYEPFMYRSESGQSRLELSRNSVVTATLTALAGSGCGVFDPYVTASHTISDDGAAIKVISENCNNVLVGIDGFGPVAWDGGTGTQDDPYVYFWTPDRPATSTKADTPSQGKTQYELTFQFTNTCRPLCAPAEYSLEFIQKANGGCVYDDQGRRELEEENGEEARSISVGVRDFYPANGTQFDVFFTDDAGIERQVMVDIPPLPLEYLFVDDYVPGAVGDNLNYDPDADLFDAPQNPVKTLGPGDVLKANVRIYTFGERAMGTGVWLEFTLSGGPMNGLSVLYNPILHPDGSGRDPNAPEITLPLFVNTQSQFFRENTQISQQDAFLTISLSQKGDGVHGFKNADLPFVIQNNGLVLLSTNHLTIFTLDSAEEEATAENGVSGGSGGDSSSCFVNSLMESFRAR